MKVGKRGGLGLGLGLGQDKVPYKYASPPGPSASLLSAVTSR